MPTLDEAIRVLPEILERLGRIEAKIDALGVYTGAPRMLYDVQVSVRRGIGRDEAYTILRRYCKKTAGRRLRITHKQLMDYYQKREE